MIKLDNRSFRIIKCKIRTQFILLLLIILITGVLVNESHGKSIVSHEFSRKTGRLKFFPDDCNSCTDCKSDICKEVLIYGDILVCKCLPEHSAKVPLLIDLNLNQF